MKALLCTHYGAPEELELKELPSPVPGKNQVLISVRACGVNFPDVLMIQDKYQFRPPLPFPPGGEIAGIVKALGEDVSGINQGDRVCVSIGNAGFAQEALADAGRCIRMPENLDFAVASAFIVTYGTSYHALKDREMVLGCRSPVFRRDRSRHLVACACSQRTARRAYCGAASTAPPPSHTS